MTNLPRSLAALLVPVAILGLSACGSSGIPHDAVVQVGGKSITKTTFNHWMQVASASTAASGGKAVIPDPPAYSACIGHLKATAPKPAKGRPKLTSAQLKTQCEQQYKSLQQQVLGFLINSAWVLGEAESLGVKASDSEVKREFEKIKNTQFPKTGQFQKFLSSSGNTASDLRLHVRLNLLSAKIQQKIAKHSGTTAQRQQEALSNWSKDFRNKWEAKTECASGYVVPDCGGHKQPQTSSTSEG